MSVQYFCEGCGYHVHALALGHPPAHGFCIQCAILSAYEPDPVALVATRKALDVERDEDRPRRFHRQPAPPLIAAN